MLANSSSLCGLLETKTDVSDVENISKNIIKSCEYLHNSINNSTIKILVIWKVQLLFSFYQMVSVDASSVDSKVSCLVSFIYGANCLQEQKELCQEMSVIYGAYAAPICYVGDFNAMRFLSNSNGGSTRWPGYYDDINACVEENELIELKASGLFFTWFTHNNGKPIQHKIDRALVNDRWLQVFPRVETKFLSHATSYHTPILLSFGVEEIGSPKTF